MNVQKLIECKWKQTCFDGRKSTDYTITYYVFYERENHATNPNYEVLTIPEYGTWRFITGHQDETDDKITEALQDWFNRFGDINSLSIKTKETNVLWRLNEEKEKALISNSAYGWSNYRLPLINTNNTVKNLHTRVYFTDRDLIAEQVASKFPQRLIIEDSPENFLSIIESQFLSRKEVETILDRTQIQ